MVVVFYISSYFNNCISRFWRINVDLWVNDKTKLSFVILAIFPRNDVHCGYESWKLSKLANKDIDKLENLDTRHEPRLVCFRCITPLGLIGTVTGFIPMLAGAFGNIAILQMLVSYNKH